MYLLPLAVISLVVIRAVLEQAVGTEILLKTNSLEILSDQSRFGMLFEMKETLVIALVALKVANNLYGVMFLGQKLPPPENRKLKVLLQMQPVLVATNGLLVKNPKMFSM